MTDKAAREKNRCALRRMFARRRCAGSRKHSQIDQGEAQMTSWVRFESAEGAGFGVLDGASIHIYEGDLFHRPLATDRSVRRDAVQLTMPVRPGKVLAVWNNFRA